MSVFHDFSFGYADSMMRSSVFDVYNRYIFSIYIVTEFAFIKKNCSEYVFVCVWLIDDTLPYQCAIYLSYKMYT